MQKAIVIATAALLGAAAVVPAVAQQLPYKIDPNAPLDVKADGGGGYDPVACTTKLEERVELTQDKTRLRGRSVTAYHAKVRGECGDIERIEARGDVFYVTPDQSIRADVAVYDMTKELATFTGNVVAMRGNDVTTSESLVVRLDSDAAELKGKVRGVIFPKGSAKK